ncbi:STAS/SEC14 domain-containing protein [Silicimonas algicola]|uniref:SpoIIAA-like protein n=1 Tax=Silicimonas algicola TaxID=1826607 RepID=A0A316GJ28_9RHOB|nr:STAS/SEC14 domain-containing protein [Silicimonas algicola]AZQ65807.1 STAS/SEC14 domain-containing protein [Silicimonas algicola]PWK54817.1 SpoIIAA-like protein [Silicimonas algicola]
MSCIYTEDKSLPVAEIQVLGRVTEHDMDEILPKLEAFIEKHGTIRIVEVIERFEGFDPTTVLDGVKFDIKHLRNVSHAAVVSDIPWIGFMTRAASTVMPLTVRTFAMSDLEAARAWARAPGA